MAWQRIYDVYLGHSYLAIASMLSRSGAEEHGRVDKNQNEVQTLSINCSTISNCLLQPGRLQVTTVFELYLKPEQNGKSRREHDALVVAHVQL